MNNLSTYVKLDCGKHWGVKPGMCSKCKYFTTLESEFRRKGLLQYNGTPWVSLLVENSK